MAESTPTTRNQPAGLRSRQKIERQADILAAAIAVMSEKGYHSTRISDIAERAGVAYGLVYHYFGSKQNILSYILESLWDRFGKRIQKISAQPDLKTAEKLTEISDYMLDTLIARPDIIRLLVQENRTGPPSGIAAEYRNRAAHYSDDREYFQRRDRSRRTAGRRRSAASVDRLFRFY